LLTKWAPYIDFSHEYSPINYPILQVNHRVEYMTVFAVVIEWLKEHQPDILANPDKRSTGIRFEADILNSQSANISIDLKLTERVIVANKDGKYHVEAVSEPVDPAHEWDSLYG
ncbi:phage tail protein, partial [Providencia stuartii]|uniref:phage tail protein n=1 Tax=Providencia stuartii TaxID=588 RepID=UPI000EF8C0E8